MQMNLCKLQFDHSDTDVEAIQLTMFWRLLFQPSCKLNNSMKFFITIC